VTDDLLKGSWSPATSFAWPGNEVEAPGPIENFSNLKLSLVPCFPFELLDVSEDVHI